MSDSVKGTRVFRILDASIDRSREAIRVLEDAARFLMDDDRLTEVLKDYRHRFAALTDRIPMEWRLESRSTETDVGVVIEGPGEYARESLEQIVKANFCRLQESLRSIEEYSKLVFPEITHSIENLRYESYTLEKEIFTACHDEPCHEEEAHPLCREKLRRKRLRDRNLYVIVDAHLPDSDLEGMIEGGVDLIQVRDKKATDRELCVAVRRYRAVLSRMESTGMNVPLLIVNDRTDIALATGADGVHLGQSEIAPAAARRMIGQEMILGLSTASPEEALDATNQPVDYIGAGPVFPSKTKSFDSFPGLDYLRYLASDPVFRTSAGSLPIYAIGGISTENLREVVATGIRRICVSSALVDASDKRGTATELKRGLDVGNLTENLSESK